MSAPTSKSPEYLRTGLNKTAELVRALHLPAFFVSFLTAQNGFLVVDMTQVISVVDYSPGVNHQYSVTLYLASGDRIEIVAPFNDVMEAWQLAQPNAGTLGKKP